ncbi:hypothetical protein [Microvirga sp. 17 mud 1-3]|uniref:hypothetical protein n=1 Tax=Microvirga sp. 17 mud 1-3 TaxID=2082949 RepID=UPI00210FF872|nr:hypothetical protein [Microvirga sp. 17 mud 1-3]
MQSLLGIEASRAAQYVIAFAIILVLVALFGLVLRKLTGGRLMLPGHDRGRSRQPRLGVVDIYDLDRQRQLVLLRRDNVEHLLLIGGLNDVVIETNIVRVAGARIPAPDAGAPERFEPSFDQAPRPQVEPSGRPSIETQLAAQLGAFIRRPSEESDVDQELAPVASVTAPAPARPEPMLKPDQVTVTAAASVEPMRPQEPPPASFLRAPATHEPPAPPVRPEPPPVRPEPRPVTPPPPFQSRPTPVPPQPPMTPAPTPAPAPEVVLPPLAMPVETKTPDAAILSDMAKQLEEALKRPAQPVAPPQPLPLEEPVAGPMDDIPEISDDLDEDELLVPATKDEEPELPEPEHREPPRPAPEPERPVATQPQPMVAPAPVPPPPPAAPAQAEAAPGPASAPKVSDPFSVEEIEAEFARLLGRPRDPASKG